ncbi:MAG: KH domain-containing protein [Andreesenia angusta]|nr:KH domain-containing protein [Andreesenia angusta]
MGEIVSVMAKHLVDKPDEVKVDVVEKGQLTVIELRVAPEDMGKVIGKHGKIAKTIRTVVKAAAIKEDKKVVINIIESK